MKMFSGVLMFLVLLTFGYTIPSFGQTTGHLAEIERLMLELDEAQGALNTAQLRLLESMYRLPAVPNHGGFNGTRFVRMSDTMITTLVFGAGQVTTHFDMIQGMGVNRLMSNTHPFRVVEWEGVTFFLVRRTPSLLTGWIYEDGDLESLFNDTSRSYMRQN